MYSLQTLDLRGYRQEAVPNIFFQQGQAADDAAIILPGRGYGCQEPVLHYPTLELVARSTLPPAEELP